MEIIGFLLIFSVFPLGALAFWNGFFKDGGIDALIGALAFTGITALIFNSILSTASK